MVRWRREENNFWTSVVLTGAAGFARGLRAGDTAFDSNSITCTTIISLRTLRVASDPYQVGNR